MKSKIPIKELAANSPTLLLLLFMLYSCDGGKSGSAVKETGTVPESGTVAKLRQGNAEKGRIVYDKYCFYCHGREGRGDGAIGIAVTPHPADFVGDKRKMAKSDEELFKSISEGIRREVGSDEMAMPRWKDILSEEERWDALAYVRELSRGKK